MMVTKQNIPRREGRFDPPPPGQLGLKNTNKYFIDCFILDHFVGVKELEEI